MDPLRPLLRLLSPLLAHPRWPVVRTALLLLHVVAVVAVACPAPIKGASRKQWERPAIRQEVRTWQKRLAGVGVKASEEELVDFAVTTTKRWSSARNTAIAPFNIYLKSVGATQGWYMFTAPDRQPMRFTVDRVLADGSLERVLELGKSVSRPDLVDPAFLDEHRVRRALFQTAWSEREGVHREVCAWFGKRIRRKAPDTIAVECSQIEFYTEHPWQERTEKQKAEKQKRTLRVDLVEKKKKTKKEKQK